MCQKYLNGKHYNSLLRRINNEVSVMGRASGGEEGQNKVVGEEEVEDVVRVQVIISK